MVLLVLHLDGSTHGLVPLLVAEHIASAKALPDAGAINQSEFDALRTPDQIETARQRVASDTIALRGLAVDRPTPSG